MCGALDEPVRLSLPEEMHWFCKPHPSRRTHHCTSFQSAPGATGTKHALAGRHRDDRDAYTEAKGAVIQAVLSPGRAASTD